MNNAAYELKPWQELAVRRLMENRKCAVWMDMGAGKTLSVLHALNELNAFPVLVVAPLRVALSVWPQEAEKWFPHLKVQVLRGNDRAQRLIKKADVYVVNYENLNWLANHTSHFRPKFETIVVDESTKLRGARSRGGTVGPRCLMKLAAGTFRFIELTGTPAPQGLIDLWGQVFLMDHGVRLGAAYSDFQNRWFYRKPNQTGPHSKLTPHTFAFEQITEKVKDLCFTIRVSDYIGVDKPIFNDVVVTLPEEVMQMYDDFKEHAALQLEDATVINATSAGIMTTKLQQLAQGAIYGEQGKYSEIHEYKLDALEEIAEEWNGTPLLVAYNYKHDLERLLKRFPYAKHLDKNPQTINAFNNGQIPMLLAHPKSAGHGLNLAQGTHILVFFGLTWDLELYSQIIERIGPMRQKQAGLHRAVHVYRIVAEGTIDQQMVKVVEKKAEVQEAVLQAITSFDF